MSSRSHPLNSTDTTKMEKIMSDLMKNNDELPKGWEWKRLGEIAEVVAGNPAPQGEEYFRDGRYPFLRVQDMGRLGNDSYIYKTHDYINDKAVQSLRLFPKGSVLFTKSGASTLLNQRAILGRDMFVVSHIAATIPHDGIMSEWLYYWLKTVDFNKLAHATTLPSLPLSKAKDIHIPIAPPVEQKLIVSEIEKQFSRLDEAVAALKRVRASLKRYKASVLKAAVEGRIVTSEQKKWKTTTVGEVSEIVTKGSSPNWQGFEYSSEGVVFVRSQNVSWGHLDLSDVAHLPLAFNKKEKKSVLRTGDVLLNIVGASIGRAAVASKSIEGGNINQAVAVIRPLRDRLLPQFLMCYFLSEKVQKLIHAQKVDVARANYSLEQIRKLPLHLPPLDDQHLIVEEIESRLSVAEEIEEIININLKRAERLRQAILKKAFSGRLV